MPLRHSLLAATVAIVWGFNFVVISWGMAGVPPLLFAAVRFTLVVVPAILVVPRPDAPWRTVLGVGAFMSLGQFSLLYLAIDAGVSAGIAALVLQAQVPFTMLLASRRLGERPTDRQIVGVAIGVAGLVVVALGRGGTTTIGALSLCLLAALSWAVGNVLSRSSGVRGGLSLTVWSALVVPLPMLALSLLVDGPNEIADALGSFGARSLASTAYTVVFASLLGYAAFNSLLARHPPAAVVPWVLLAPIVAALSGWVLLDQRTSPGELVGGLVVLVGLSVAMATPRPRPTREDRTATAGPTLTRSPVQSSAGRRR